MTLGISLIVLYMAESFKHVPLPCKQIKCLFSDESNHEIDILAMYIYFLPTMRLNVRVLA